MLRLNLKLLLSRPGLLLPEPPSREGPLEGSCCESAMKFPHNRATGGIIPPEAPFQTIIVGIGMKMEQIT
jgi:hypothetical protein